MNINVSEHPDIYTIAFPNGRVWVQRKAAIRATDSPIAGHETVIIELCKLLCTQPEALRYTEEQRRLLDDIERDGLYNVLNAALYAGNRARVDAMKGAIKRGLAPSETGRSCCLRCGADWNNGQIPNAPKRCRCGKEFDPERFCPDSPVGAPCMPALTPSPQLAMDRVPKPGEAGYDKPFGKVFTE